MVEEHPVILVAKTDVGLEYEESPALFQNPVHLSDRFFYVFPFQMLEKIAAERHVDRSAGYPAHAGGARYDGLDVLVREFFYVFVEVDGNFSSGLYVVDELAIPRTDVGDRGALGNVFLENPSQNFPHFVPELRIASEAPVVHPAQVVHTRFICTRIFKTRKINYSMVKTIIVTGGAGFIGSHLCEWLCESNHVTCVDNLVTGRKENIKLLLRNPNFTFVEHDVSKPFRVQGPVDQIYHLSSPASPIDYQKLPIETMMVNSVGTKNMLDLANEKRARILIASTSEVYGDPEKHPQSEDYWGRVNPIGPRSCYDESKRFAEALAMAYCKTHYLDVKIARIFNTFGPRMRSNDGRVIPNFVTQALKNEDITVYGDGKQTRSFCYITDLVDGLIKLMESGKSGEIMNLGNPDERQVIDVAKTIKELTNSSSKIVFMPLPKDDPTRRKPDIRRAKEKLNWEPRVAFESGLKKTIDWFKGNE